MSISTMTSLGSSFFIPLLFSFLPEHPCFSPLRLFYSLLSLPLSFLLTIPFSHLDLLRPISPVIFPTTQPQINLQIDSQSPCLDSNLPLPFFLSSLTVPYLYSILALPLYLFIFLIPFYHPIPLHRPCIHPLTPMYHSSTLNNPLYKPWTT